ncbi:hypothetical protein HID58_040479 [Brassica napus]|uniref:Uncharacterized protein n=1 Tax=Brassica napus TaxID=3708 RepID=A0ABQ8B849_BRANA|nr:hypothetical protein HID58_040479 [Brassica napus]
MVSREVFFSVLAVISGGGDLADAIESLRLKNHLSRDVCGEEVLEWLGLRRVLPVRSGARRRVACGGSSLRF